MSGVGLVAGLADSVFLADVDAHDRDTARLALTLAGGVTLGYAAATLVDVALGGLPHTLQDLLFDTIGREVIDRRVTGFENAIAREGVGNGSAAEDDTQSRADFFKPRWPRVIPNRLLSGRWFDTFRSRYHKRTSPEVMLIVRSWER